MPRRFRQGGKEPGSKQDPANAQQRFMNARAFEVLDRFDLPKQELLCVEFFFYARTEGTAASLREALTAIGYKVAKPSLSLHGNWCVCGWTPPQPSEEHAFGAWTDAMIRLAERFESVFDGWATIPEQGPDLFDRLVEE